MPTIFNLRNTQYMDFYKHSLEIGDILVCHEVKPQKIDLNTINLRPKRMGYLEIENHKVGKI